MQRKYRLTSSLDIKRVRRFGKSYAHPFLVLIKYPNDLKISRFAIAAGRSIGNAVQRNRAKRRLRALVNPLIQDIQPGWDLLILARTQFNQATHQQLQGALDQIIVRAGLKRKHNGS
jgi:ribonuclease P protein component